VICITTSKMTDYYTLKLDKENLEEHVERICRRNLQRVAKICTHCPILGPVVDIMESYHWAYNQEGVMPALKEYYSRMDKIEFGE
jgi:hypothetical protein